MPECVGFYAIKSNIVLIKILLSCLHSRIDSFNNSKLTFTYALTPFPEAQLAAVMSIVCFNVWKCDYSLRLSVRYQFILSDTTADKIIPMMMFGYEIRHLVLAPKQKSDGKTASVYTDGCCHFNGKHGACGGIGVYWGPDDDR